MLIDVFCDTTRIYSQCRLSHSCLQHAILAGRGGRGRSRGGGRRGGLLAAVAARGQGRGSQGQSPTPSSVVRHHIHYSRYNSFVARRNSNFIST
jgi:hypothetical protein